MSERTEEVRLAETVRVGLEKIEDDLIPLGGLLVEVKDNGSLAKHCESTGLSFEMANIAIDLHETITVAREAGDNRAELFLPDLNKIRFRLIDEMHEARRGQAGRSAMSYDLQPHPLAEMIPLMLDKEYEDLKADIQANNYKLREKIVLYEGKVLDGRHRERALSELGIPWEENSRQFDPETEGDPVSFVISLNLKRRHLTVGQLASVGSELLKLLKKQTPKAPRGRPPEPHTNNASGETGETRESAMGAEKNSALINAELYKKVQEMQSIAAQQAGTSIDAIKRFNAIENKNPRLPRK
jgi:hypothetical protein